MADKKLEFIKYEERLDFAIDLLKRKYPNVESKDLVANAISIATTLFIQSERSYSMNKKQ